MLALEITAIAISTAALIVSLIGGAFSIYSYFRNKAIEAYTNLDALYLEVLKFGIANPRFADASLTRDYHSKFSGDERQKYELYAFIAWNVCETIYDRRRNKAVLKSWCPIIKTENNLHRAWFDDPKNHSKFKPEFRRYILENFPFSNAAD